MENLKPTSEEYFKSLGIIHFALIAGQVLFGLLSCFLELTKSLEPSTTDAKGVLIYIAPVLVLGGFLFSNILFKNRLKSIDRNSEIMLKLTDYREALIVRYALLEGPSLFSIVSYLLTGNIIFILSAAIIVLYFLTLRPTKEKAIRDLELNADEEMILTDQKKEF